jgi:hypothetical protein
LRNSARTSEDVTAQIPALPKKGVTEKAAQQRQAAIKRIETDCGVKGGETGEVVNLFWGSRYKLVPLQTL